MAATYKFVVGGVTKDLITDYGLYRVKQILGAGMPPVEPVITPYALTDGAYYQRRIVGPRIISLVCVAQGASLTALHTIRKTVIDDIGSGAAFVFKYTPNNGTISELSIDVRYAGGLELGDQEAYSEELVIRLLAVEPYWYTAAGSPSAITINETATACSAHRRASLDWSSMTGAGAPTGTVPANGIAVSSDGTTVYVCQGSSLYRWASGTWTSWAANAAVNCVCMAVSGTGCHVGGAFTTINGVAASKVATFDGTSTFTALGAGSPVGDVTAIAADSNDIYVGGNSGDRLDAYDGSWAGYAYYTGAGTILTMINVGAGFDRVMWVGANNGALKKIDNSGTETTPAVTPSAGNINALASDAQGVLWVGGSFTLAGVTTYLAGWNGVAWVTPTGIASEVKALSIAADGTLRAGLATSPGIWRKIGGNVMIGDYGFRAAGTVTALGSASAADVQVVGQDTASASTWWCVTSITDSSTVSQNFTLTLTVASGATAPVLYSIANLTTGQHVQMNATLAGAETITLSTADGSIQSSTRGSIVSDIVNAVSPTALRLQSGANNIAILVYDPSSKATATRTLAKLNYMSADGLS